MTATVWHWLVASGGILKALIAWAVGFAMGGLVVKGLGGGIRRAWREHIETQRVIASRLDPHTPGGIGDIIVPVRQSPLAGQQEEEEP